VKLDGLRTGLRRTPFQPFAMKLADGRSVAVKHPDFVAVGPRIVVVVDADDSWSVIEPLLIVSLDKLPRRGGSRNGKQRGS
jgi:hypothetical protein